MAGLQPNESRPPFQEVPRCFIHVHELDILIQQMRDLLSQAECLKEASLRSERRVAVAPEYASQSRIIFYDGPPESISIS